MRRAVAVAALVLAVGAAGCSKDQDPGIPSAPTVEGGTTVAPRLPQDCPPGGPDATTPEAGCVGEDGRILH